MWNDQIGISSVFGLFQKTPVDNSIVNGTVLMSKKKVRYPAWDSRGAQETQAAWRAGIRWQVFTLI